MTPGPRFTKSHLVKYDRNYSISIVFGKIAFHQFQCHDIQPNFDRFEFDHFNAIEIARKWLNSVDETTNILCVRHFLNLSKEGTNLVCSRWLSFRGFLFYKKVTIVYHVNNQRKREAGLLFMSCRFLRPLIEGQYFFTNPNQIP